MNKWLVVVVVAVVLLIAGFLVFNMNGNAVKSDGKVLLKTTKGDIVIELYGDKAPVTVSNFLQYVEDGYYDGLVFHRVISGFMIQGGGFDEKGVEKATRAPIKLESNNGLKNNEGYIAMARTSVPNSATSQFFINTENNDFLNYGVGNDGYAVFGKVIEGMDVVKKIESSNTAVRFGMEDWPVENVVIIKAEII